MIRVNNKLDFEVYTWETTPDIIKRLAARMNTLPGYLFLDKPSQMGIKDLLLKGGSINIGDKLQELIKMPINDFHKWIDKDGELYFPLDKKRLDIYRYITEITGHVGDVPMATVFISFNKELANFSSTEEVTAVLHLLNNSLTGHFVDVVKIWNYRLHIKKIINKAIQTNQTDVIDIEKLISVEPKKYTAFQREAVSLHLEWDFSNLTILEVFDLIVLTPHIPFACSNNIYKILRDSTPDPNWEMKDDVIYFKMLVGDTDNYIDIVMEMTGDPGQEIGSMYTDPLPYGKGLTEEIFLDNLQRIFPSITLVQKSIDIVKEKGRFFYFLGDKPLDRYIMSDLVMNDPLYNRYIAFDESSAASKGKRWSLYLHFFGEKGRNIVNANITVYCVREKDDAHKIYKYPIGSFYLSVLISDVNSQQNINNFTTIFGKLLKLYYSKAPAIESYYQNLLGADKFPEEFKERAAIIPGKKTRKTLAHQAPKLFVTNYPTKCPHPPRIISEQEKVIVETKGYDVMRYPKTANEEIQQRWFVCDSHKKHRYPGLKKNDLSNRSTVPYLPCCMQRKQDKGVNNYYDHYFYDQPLIKRVGGNQGGLISRPIFINPPAAGGSLPTDLDEMLNLINKNEQIFLRAGVSDSKSSFLHCVIESLSENGDEDLNEILSDESDHITRIRSELDSLRKEKKKKKKKIDAKTAELWEEKNKYLVIVMNNLRNEMATPEMAESCKQEMYNYSTDEIIEAIRDPNVYLDPRHFVNMIERKYNCNIIVLSRVKYNQAGEPVPSLVTTMSLPKHTQSYYKMKRETTTIVLYEHMGGSTDHQTYPRCEIIGKLNSDGKDYYSYPSGTIIAKNLGDIYDKLFESYRLNCPVNLSTLSKIFLINKGISPLSQSIDSYGKCRSITFTYKGKKGIFLTSPMQPMILKQSDGIMYRLPLHLVIELMNSLNVTPVKETVTDYYTSAFTVILEGVNISIPFIQDEKMKRSNLETVSFNDLKEMSLEMCLQPRHNKEKMIDDIVAEMREYESYKKDKIDHTIPGRFAVEEDITMTENQPSILDTYINDKRIARYLTDYIRWYYSSFLFSKGLTHTDDNLSLFIGEKTEIDPGFQYGHISKIFSEDDGVSKNNNLCLKSEETLKRLLYTLEIFISRYSHEFEQYRLRRSISNYYLGVGDFTKYRTQVILQGDGAIIKWINERQKDYSIYKGIIPAKGLSPYFVKNSLIEDGNICLLQGASSLSSSLNISDTWNKLNMNDSNVINENEETKIGDKEYNIYSYQSPSEIKEYSCDKKGYIPGGKDSNNTNLVGYRQDDEVKFLSVLSLEKCVV